METADFLARQETGEFGARILLHAPGQVGLDVSPGNCMVHDLPEHEQRRVRAAGCCRALYPSNHRITPVLSILSSGTAPNTGSS